MKIRVEFAKRINGRLLHKSSLIRSVKRVLAKLYYILVLIHHYQSLLDYLPEYEDHRISFQNIRLPASNALSKYYGNCYAGECFALDAFACPETRGLTPVYRSAHECH